jgi:hypothetical protein
MRACTAHGLVAVSQTLRATVAAQSAPAHPAPSATTDSFDQLYERGQRVNATIRTLTAQFTETTTSSLLVRPLVARGTLAVERPSRVVLHYAEPESRIVLIYNNKMTMTWPSRQVMDVGAAMGRVQRYFVDGSAADLRRQFDIDDKQANDRPGTFRVASSSEAHPRARQAGAVVDRESFLLSSMHDLCERRHQDDDVRERGSERGAAVGNVYDWPLDRGVVCPMEAADRA